MAWIAPTTNRRSVLALGLGLATSSMFPARARGGPDSFAPLAKLVTPAVLNIAAIRDVTTTGHTATAPGRGQLEEMTRRFGQARRPPAAKRATALGSGFLIDAGGVAVTNNHVVESATEIHAITNNGRSLRARLTGDSFFTNDCAVSTSIFSSSFSSKFMSASSLRREAEDHLRDHVALNFVGAAVDRRGAVAKPCACPLEIICQPYAVCCLESCNPLQLTHEFRFFLLQFRAIHLEDRSRGARRAAVRSFLHGSHLRQSKGVLIDVVSDDALPPGGIIDPP